MIGVGWECDGAGADKAHSRDADSGLCDCRALPNWRACYARPRRRSSDPRWCWSRSPGTEFGICRSVKRRQAHDRSRRGSPVPVVCRTIATGATTGRPSRNTLRSSPGSPPQVPGAGEPAWYSLPEPTPTLQAAGSRKLAKYGRPASPCPAPGLRRGEGGGDQADRQVFGPCKKVESLNRDVLPGGERDQPLRGNRESFPADRQPSDRRGEGPQEITGQER